MIGQTMLASLALAAEAATGDGLPAAVDTPATGQAFAFGIALAAFLVIGTLLFFHRWSRRRGANTKSHAAPQQR